MPDHPSGSFAQRHWRALAASATGLLVLTLLVALLGGFRTGDPTGSARPGETQERETVPAQQPGRVADGEQRAGQQVP